MEDELRPRGRGGPRSRSARAARKGASNKETNASRNEEASRRKAELEASIRKKIEYERKALHIVEQLLEEDVTEEFLVRAGKHITSAHYKDVVEERFIIKLCGYPLCHNKLGNVPKQKYRISTKTNKVYDITERKFFCSNFCYRASKFFEAQISKSPLWVREEERPPDLHLLKEGQSGHSGEEVKLRDEAVKSSDIENPSWSKSQDESGSSSTHSHSSSDDEQGFVSSLLPGNKSKVAPGRQQPYPKSILKKSPGQKANSRHQDKDQKAPDVTEQLSRCTLDGQEKASTCALCLREENSYVSPDFSSEKSKALANSEDGCDRSQITFVGISKKGAEHFRRKFAKLNLGQSGTSPLQMTYAAAKVGLFEALKKTLVEWRTEETLKFLHGQNYVPPTLTVSPSTPQSEDGNRGQEALIPGLESHISTVTRMSQNTLDQALPFSSSGTATHPLPSYESLKKETEALNLKIKEFYKGKYVLDEQLPESETTDKEVDPTYPLIDSSSQNQIRKRIVLEKLSQVFPGILGPLQVTLSEIYTELKNLIQTFRLTNKNIIHKPAEWTLIAIVLFSVLSQVISIQKHSQKNAMYTQFIATLLKELHFKNEDLERLTGIFKTNFLPE